MKDLSPGPFSRNLSAFGGNDRATVSPFLISTVTSPKLATLSLGGRLRAKLQGSGVPLLGKAAGNAVGTKSLGNHQVSPASCFHKLARVKDTQGLGDAAALRAGTEEEDMSPEATEHSSKVSDEALKPLKSRSSALLFAV